MWLWVLIILLFTGGWWIENWSIVGFGILASLPLIALFFGLLGLVEWATASAGRFVGAIAVTALAGQTVFAALA